jgi:alkylhydroperoxidase/carboxymuconolactone decarboxylase family protein YurZ
MQFQAMSPLDYSPPQQTFEQIEQEFGVNAIPQIFKLLESQPALLTHLWGQFHTLVLQGDLPRVLKEMVGLVIATATHCDHLYVVLMQSLAQQHAEPQTLTAIAEGDYESAAVSHATLSVLRFTAMAIVNRTAGGTLAKSKWQLLQQQTKQALDDTGLEEGEQLELVATIALFEQLCLVANLLQLDPL